MIKISDSNRFDLNQAHARGGLACGHQHHLSEDKGVQSASWSLGLSCAQERSMQN